MIRRGTWITLGVFVAVLLFALWLVKGRPAGSSVAEATPTPEPLWQVEGTEVASLRVEDLSAGRALEVRRREEGGWEVLRPAGGALGDDAIEMAVTWLESPRPRAVLSPGDDLAVYGLDQPHARITLILRGGPSRVLEVGSDTPSGTTTYVRLPGTGSVYVVSKYGLGQVLGLVEDAYTPTPTPTAEAPLEATPTPG